MGCYFHICSKGNSYDLQTTAWYTAPRFVVIEQLTSYIAKSINMTKALKLWISIVCTAIIFSSCGALKTPVIVRNAPIEGYRYVFITPTKELTSSAGGTYGGRYGIYGASTTKSVNPSDVISGELIKNGFIILPELKSELNNKTLIVNYGESGRRNRGLGYTIEVTIQFISAETHELICSCTAEGQGETEADDIRQAIRRALSGLFNNK